MKRTKYTLLFVEDEAMIRKIAVGFLRPYFEDIIEAADGREAWEAYEANKPDLIITDIQMPHMDGLDLCREIRKVDKRTPMLITTAFTSTEYLLDAVGLNLVKYLVKPVQEDALFEALELCFAHIESDRPSVIQIEKNAYVDMLNHTYTKDEKVVVLTESQHKFLEILLKHNGRMVSYLEIERHIWYDKVMSNDALRSLVRDVRKIIGKEAIANISKHGYRIHLYA